MRTPGVRLLKRVAGGEAAAETAYTIEPQGAWQFDMPLVILIDEGTAWPSDALLCTPRGSARRW